MLQAHTEEEFQAWVSAIQSGVTKAFRDAEKQQMEQQVYCLHHESKTCLKNR